jgi:hypothetical protein
MTINILFEKIQERYKKTQNFLPISNQKVAKECTKNRFDEHE